MNRPSADDLEMRALDEAFRKRADDECRHADGDLPDPDPARYRLNLIGDPEPTPADLGYDYAGLTRSDKIWLWCGVAAMMALCVGLAIVGVMR